MPIHPCLRVSTVNWVDTHTPLLPCNAPGAENRALTYRSCAGTVPSVFAYFDLLAIEPEQGSMELPYPVVLPQAPLLDLERRSLVFRRARPWTTFHHYRSFQNLNQIVLRCALDPPSPDVLAWPLVLLAFDTEARRIRRGAQSVQVYVLLILRRCGKRRTSEY